MPKKFALLIDTTSIQKYVFSCNRLAENVGASYIIEHCLYSNAFMGKTRVTFTIGYIGGGNALLLFNCDEDRKRFIAKYSMNGLTHFPGVRLAFGTYDLFDGSKEDDNFRKSMRFLNESLLQNRMQIGSVLPFKHGIVDDCPLSNEAAEIFDTKEGTYISRSSKAKINYAKESDSILEEEYKEALNNNWVFTTKIEELGQPEEKSYIAVVHIDGNGMGDMFSKTDCLGETNDLSREVKNLASKSLKQLFEYIINKEKYLIKENGFNIREEGGKKTLPIRPIISGGDDFTFVCEGKLGVHLAKKLLEFLTEEQIGVDKKNISACAGVAIVNSKFPFFKAYQLAEQLCAEAKKLYRENKHEKLDSSYLSFFIQRDGVSGELEDMIQMQYGHDTGIYHQVYEISGAGDFRKLEEQIRNFKQEKSWSKSRLMQLRTALYATVAEREYFVEMFNARKKEDNINENKQQTVRFEITDEKILHDAIELYDFYPEFLLPEKNNNDAKD